MTRRFRDPVAVAVTAVPDGVPTSFIWCGRRYRIDSVLTRWVEAGNWWLDMNAAFRRAERSGQFPVGLPAVTSERAVLSEVEGTLVTATATAEEEATAEAEATAAEATAEAEAELIALDREIWRVEAVCRMPGAARRGGVYDLVHDRETKKWQLARVWD